MVSKQIKAANMFCISSLHIQAANNDAIVIYKFKKVKESAKLIFLKVGPLKKVLRSNPIRTTNKEICTDHIA